MVTAPLRKHAQSRALIWVARIGYIARGTVFLIIGVFALLAAVGARARPAGMGHALQWLFERPFGGLLLWTVALGLACFAGWRMMQGVFDAERRGNTVAGLLARGVLTCNAAFYLVLAATTGDIAFEVAKIKEDKSARDWTAWLLAKPLGQVAVGLIALGFVVTAISLVVTVVRNPRPRRIDSHKMPVAWAAALGMFGVTTRAAVFLIIGAFLGFAAYDANSSDVVGIPGALHDLQQQPYGSVLLAVAALGLIAFAAFEFIEAWARQIGPLRMPQIGGSSALPDRARL